VWLTGAVVCLLAANRKSNCSLTQVMDGRIVAVSLAPANQLALPRLSKRFWPPHVRSAVASTGLYLFTFRTRRHAPHTQHDTAPYTSHACRFPSWYSHFWDKLHVILPCIANIPDKTCNADYRANLRTVWKNTRRRLAYDGRTRW